MFSVEKCEKKRAQSPGLAAGSLHFSISRISLLSFSENPKLSVSDLHMSEIKNLIAESSDEFSDVSDDFQESKSSLNSEAKKKARIERAKKNASIWTNNGSSVSFYLNENCILQHLILVKNHIHPEELLYRWDALSR